jgi:hypothetical protein
MKYYLSILLLFFVPLLLCAQEENNFQEKSSESKDSNAVIESLSTPLIDSIAAPADTAADGKKKKEKKIKEAKAPRVKLPPDTLARPIVGIGIGLLSFNGDVKSNENVNIPLSGGLGTQLSISQSLSPSFNVNFNMLFSRLSANERSLERNLNFQTQIFTAGFNFQYNFKNFFPGHRNVVPYISLGIENIEFSTKTDLVDAYGNQYNYWSDGTIRNLPESSPNSDQSVLLQRDYVYETDIRSSAYPGGGDYDERAFGLPITIGADINLTSKIDFGFSWTYHFTTTDDIDGVNSNTPSSLIGSRLPNGRNDHFWYLNASLRYNFTRSATGKMEIRDQWSTEELMAFDQDDYDGDGIPDFMDECPQTAFGVEVNERGCPLNPERPPVLTDSQIYARYLSYIDSTGLYTKIEKRAFSSTDKKKFVATPKGKKSFKIKLGEFVGGVPLEVQNALLSIPDVETHKFGDTTIFTIGDYNNLPEAIQRKIQIAIEGFEDAEIVLQNEKGKIVGLGDESGNIDLSGAEYEPNYESPFIFRVQLGAFKKKPAKSAFKNVKNLVVVENEQGYSKYMSGAFENYLEASQHKIEMIADGWQGAFVVAYKRGQGRRVTMEEAGVTDEIAEQAKAVISGQKLPKATEPTKPVFDKTRVKFKIQIGIYKNQVPPDVLSEYMKLNDLAEIEVDNSSAAKRYTSGEFTSYNDALEYRNKLIQKGFETAFIIALKDGELISIDDARKLLGDTE